MGYLVETSGRLLLPEELERQALTVLEVELVGRDGPFDDPATVDTLAELATVAGAEVRRDGDWLQLGTDEDGDPKWSDQATAFYVGLGRWVRQGEVRLTGEDGFSWSYRFGPDGVIQVGQNGWDGSLVPFGDPVPAGPGGTAERQAPRGTGRALVMAALLVVGVLLVVGIAVLGAGAFG